MEWSPRAVDLIDYSTRKLAVAASLELVIVKVVATESPGVVHI